MTGGLSRTKLASYAADRLIAGDQKVIEELAAYLMTARRTKELDLVVRSIYEALEKRGVVIAEVVTAEKMSDDLRSQIAKLLGAKQLELREHVDQNVLGGVKLSTPTKILDATLSHRLMQLRERKI
ncbi:F0F1 ATP synthase subunit delta [Candidatus Saccharibacteria bacterium]|jgi:F0F1-type ATP synthase delta subunit|nr:F0F1 ATP synthase subunit delta [Candidatus Saccharibacteria bacterium]